MTAPPVDLLIIDAIMQAGVDDDIDVWRGIVLPEKQDGAAEAVADEAAEFDWVQAVTLSSEWPITVRAGLSVYRFISMRESYVKEGLRRGDPLLIGPMWQALAR